MDSSSLLPKPPIPQQIPHVTTIHGVSINDPFFWMRDRENSAVIDHLKAENKYTEAWMEDTKPLQETLYKEMLARIKETDLSVPVKIGDYDYYTRTEQGKQYAIHCRKLHGPESSTEEIILDQNQLAEGHAYFRVGILKISPDQNLLAYSVDTDGSETYTLFVKNLRSGTLLSDVIPGTYPNFEWAADSQTFFYTVIDAAKRPYRLLRHALGTDCSIDPMIYQENDEAYFVSIYKTKDRKYLVLDLHSKITSECHFLLAADPMGPWTLVQSREQGMEYGIEHDQGHFLIVTNHDAVNFRLMEVKVENPGKKYWKDVIGPREQTKLEGVEVFKDRWVVYERENGLIRMRVFSREKKEDYYLEHPEPVYTAHGAGNPESESKKFRFEYTSLVTPSSVFDYDFETRTQELKKQQEVLGGYDASQYQSERLWAVSQDGVKVPVSIVYKKGMERNGKNPVYLYGYGSYGISMDPGFSSTRLSLLNRGFIFALAHIRGGGDLGRPWYEDGKFLKKKNTFFDFIAAAEMLVREKYTSPECLAISGGSAGGLLMGAVTNLRPELFKAVVADVPFVDVVNTMRDASLPLTVTEYEEWGNPEQKEYFDYIRSYSPYDNVVSQKYPAMLITGGLNDPRVSYWEPAKWAAKIRLHNTSLTPIVLLKMEMDSGHGGPSGRYSALRELAFEYAFLLKVLNRGSLTAT